MMTGVKLVVALLVLLLAGCSSSSSSPDASVDPVTAPGAWLAMAPGDAIPLRGEAGELVLIYVDETYDIDGTYASALTWELDDHYTTDYFVQDDDGALWWYGRKGEWRAGRHGEEPRRLEIVDGRVRFGDIVLTLSDDGVPVEARTPDGEFTA